DFQSQAMAGPVKESSHPTVAPTGLVSLGVEEFHHRFVHLQSRHAGLHFLKRDFLRTRDGVVKFAYGLGGAALDDGLCDVAEVTGLLRARENINDDRLVRAQDSVALLVRVTPLSAPRDDGVTGETSGLDDGDVNDGP